jgi:hypothetical protein
MKKIKQKLNGASSVAQYKTTFLQPTGFLARNGKSVYISGEFHQKISHIVFMLGDGKITISDYLYNLVEHHFQDFGEDIKALYNEKDKPIF